ncbi:hypothetical protein BKA69DRAFT_1122685 [Paraphysoderma sedebokerense]|nr:hypothetical protein BKA69DRAFT_1122685 [Paraphysoderma sedebokerense]
MTIYLFSVKREPEISKFPVHKYEGVITEQITEYFFVCLTTAYEVTFVPPKWLPDGEYLLSFNFGNQRQSYVHFAVQIGAKLTGDVRGESILDHPPVQALESTLENFKLSSEFDRDTWKDELTEKLKSSDLSLQDEMWEVGQRLAKEDPKLELVSTPTTVKEICRYARLDSEIQQLFFKYGSQSDVMTVSRWALAERPPHTDITIPWLILS